MMAVLAVIATLTLTSSGTQAAATTCPDGTNSGETLICAASPPVGTNADANLGALLGDDDLDRVLAMVHVAHKRHNGADLGPFGNGRAGED